MAVLFLLMVHVCFVLSDTIREGKYKNVDGKLELTNLIEEYELVSKPDCLSRCLATPSCRSAGINKQDEVCRLYDTCPDPDKAGDPLWRLYSLHGDVQEFVWIDDWVLVFRGIPYTNVSIYDVYTTPGLFHDRCGDYIPDDCLRIKSSPGSCDRHFRSKILDMWDQYTITLVRIILVKDGDVVGNVTFDNVGANMTSWMNSTRIVDASWPDLEPTAISYCAFEGHPITSRRLYINHVFNYCSGDAGWIMIIDGLEKHLCPYETVTSYPVIFYGIGVNTVWANPSTRGEADSLSILVKVTP